MIRTLTAISLVAFSFIHGYDSPAFSQAPAFEVASITPCKPGMPAPPMEHAGIADFIAPGGRFTARATTLGFLLEWSYGIQPSQHSSGPSWLDLDRFDIVAKADGKATEEQMKLMIRTLLADRFRLELHREQREVSAYVISVGKTAPKLLPAKAEEIHALLPAPQMGPDQKITSYRINATRYSLAQLADVFARQLGSVIVNDTGLEGEFDFTFDLTPDESRPNPMDPSLLIAAMRDQLGLTIRYQKTPVDFYVIDRAERVAAGN
jgi:uncharacterized protein (TIGR03435 family)